MGVDGRLHGWGANLQEEDENKNQHPYHNERGLLNKPEKRYDTGNQQLWRLIQTLKKFHHYVYGLRFLMETHAKTLVHQLNLPANDLPGALVT
jgi:hypothetical protein